MNRIDRCVEEIKKAYLSHVPIVWLVTNNKEDASLVVETFAEEHLGGMISMGTSKYGKITTVEEIKPNEIFYDWIGNEFETTKSAHDKIGVYLERFVNVFMEIKTEADARLQNASFSMSIVASPYMPKLSWLNNYIKTIHIPFPDDIEISSILTVVLDENFVIDNDFKEKLIVNFRGFSSREINQVLLHCQHAGFFDDKEYDAVLNEIRQRKRSKLQGFPGLKWEILDENMVPATGLEIVTQWLTKRKEIFLDPVKSRLGGFDVPKGLLITGIPGSGKSLMAKESARILGLPLISMDLGDIQEGLVGKSEEHMANALRMVDAMAPCVLWIDEIEKAFAGAESGQGDGGVMRRMFGKFLTWMQEKKSYCFVFATANDITKLPPELFRSERFDEKFFNFMPTIDECADIFVANLNNHNKHFETSNKRVLFDGSLCKKDYWIDFLNRHVLPNSEDIVLNDDGSWNNGIRPQTKLFTGADVSSFVKLLKFKLLYDRTNPESNNYGKRGAITRVEVNNCIDELLNGFMPYGQTNLTDLAECFLKLAKKRFRAASNSIDKVISFEEYDETKCAINYDPNKLSKDSKYNRTLYRSLVGAINSRNHQKDGNNIQSENK